MGQINDLKNDIIVSLYYKPATIEELMTRDFLKYRGWEGVERLLQQAENDGFVYFRFNRYHTYKRINKLPRFSEYEL